jgi:hypothetical protein
MFIKIWKQKIYILKINLQRLSDTTAVNYRYNDSVVDITVHLNTQKYSKAETFSKKSECIVM